MARKYVNENKLLHQEAFEKLLASAVAQKFPNELQSINLLESIYPYVHAVFKNLGNTRLHILLSYYMNKAATDTSEVCISQNSLAKVIDEPSQVLPFESVSESPVDETLPDDILPLSTCAYPLTNTKLKIPTIKDIPEKPNLQTSTDQIVKNYPKIPDVQNSLKKTIKAYNEPCSNNKNEIHTPFSKHSGTQPCVLEDNDNDKSMGSDNSSSILEKNDESGISNVKCDLYTPKLSRTKKQCEGDFQNQLNRNKNQITSEAKKNTFFECMPVQQSCQRGNPSMKKILKSRLNEQSKKQKQNSPVKVNKCLKAAQQTTSFSFDSCDSRFESNKRKKPSTNSKLNKACSTPKKTNFVKPLKHSEKSLQSSNSSEIDFLPKQNYAEVSSRSRTSKTDLVIQESSNSKKTVNIHQKKGSFLRPEDDGESCVWSDDDNISIREKSSFLRNGRVKFTLEEEDFVRKGIKKYGVGNWRVILKNYGFHPSRTNVSIKDKYRTLKRQGNL